MPTIPPLKLLKWLGAFLGLATLFGFTVTAQPQLAIFVPIFWFLPGMVRDWRENWRQRRYRVTDRELEEWLK